jgi:rare lipoprotein A
MIFSFSSRVLLLLSLLVGAFFSAYTQVIEEGVASYYNDNLEGRKTASGELYHKTGFTAAHKTMPFGTLLLVTRIDNGKSVVVRVNDRGPHSATRVIDLSKAAAEKIDLIKAGVSRVRIEVYKPEEQAAPEAVVTNPGPATPPPPPPAQAPPQAPAEPVRPAFELPSPSSEAKKFLPPPGAYATPAAKNSEFYRITSIREEGQGYGLQVGVFAEIRNLLDFAETVKQAGFTSHVLQIAQEQGVTTYRLIVGPYASLADATTVQEQLKLRNIPSVILSLATP